MTRAIMAITVALSACSSQTGQVCGVPIIDCGKWLSHEGADLAEIGLERAGLSCDDVDLTAVVCADLTGVSDIPTAKIDGELMVHDQQGRCVAGMALAYGLGMQASQEDASIGWAMACVGGSCSGASAAECSCGAVLLADVCGG